MSYLRGQVATLAKINVETLRYYEKFGLIAKPIRNKSGYRIYDDDTLERLKIIEGAKTCGFSLAEIKGLMAILYGENIDYDNIVEIIDSRIEVIDTKINEFQNIKKILNTIKNNVKNKIECPIKKIL